MTEIPCYVWDFTLSYYDSEGIKRDIDILKEDLSKIAKKWAFQLERGEQTGYEHFQGRLSLKDKLRKSGMKLKLSALGYRGIHISKTSGANKTNEFYVMKEETRIDGPWTDAMISKKNQRIPRDIVYINKVGLRPFQLDIQKQCLIFDDEHVDVYIHPKGMAGKSKIIKKLCIDGLGEELPFCNDYKDIMRMAYDVQTSYVRKYLKDCPAFFIDMPRASSKDRLYQLYAAIEKLKGGFAYDDRYAYKKCYFDPPRVFVFTNQPPDTSLLTFERWRLLTITEDYRTVPWGTDTKLIEKTEEQLVEEDDAHLSYQADNLRQLSDINRLDFDFDELDISN